MQQSNSQLLSAVVNRRRQRDHGDQEEGFVESDHTGRLERGQDVADEPVCQQEVHQPVQGDHRRRFPDQGGDGRRPDRHDAGEQASARS